MNYNTIGPTGMPQPLRSLKEDRMRMLAMSLALLAAAAGLSAAPSAEDVALVEKYKSADFSPGSAVLLKDYGDQKIYRLPDSSTLWALASGNSVIETPEKVVIWIYLRAGKELGRSLSLPSGRTCETDPDGQVEWGMALEPAPDFALSVLGGSGPKIKLSERRGKVLLIDFWASWCQPCMSSLPETQKLYQKYKGRGLEVYGINIEGDAAKAAAAAKSLGLSFPVLMGEPDSSGRYDWNCKQITDYRVSGIPALFLVDQDGVVVSMDPDEKEIERLLGR
jgi:thiol-disulfide isomerase/thioredoxin